MRMVCLYIFVYSKCVWQKGIKQYLSAGTYFYLTYWGIKDHRSVKLTIYCTLMSSSIGTRVVNVIFSAKEELWLNFHQSKIKHFWQYCVLIRQLSRHLVGLWVTGHPTAMGLLRRILVSRSFLLEKQQYLNHHSICRLKFLAPGNFYAPF